MPSITYSWQVSSKTFPAFNQNCSVSFDSEEVATESMIEHIYEVAARLRISVPSDLVGGVITLQSNDLSKNNHRQHLSRNVFA